MVFVPYKPSILGYVSLFLETPISTPSAVPTTEWRPKELEKIQEKAAAKVPVVLRAEKKLPFFGLWKILDVQEACGRLADFGGLTRKLSAGTWKWTSGRDFWGSMLVFGGVKRVCRNGSNGTHWHARGVSSLFSIPFSYTICLTYIFRPQHWGSEILSPRISGTFQMEESWPLVTRLFFGSSVFPYPYAVSILAYLAQDSTILGTWNVWWSWCFYMVVSNIFVCSPRTLGRSSFDQHIFQMGWWKTTNQELFGDLDPRCSM